MRGEVGSDRSSIVMLGGRMFSKPVCEGAAWRLLSEVCESDAMSVKRVNWTWESQQGRVSEGRQEEGAVAGRCATRHSAGVADLRYGGADVLCGERIVRRGWLAWKSCK